MDSLEQLDGIDTSNAVRQFYEVFYSINQMDMGSAIAAHQTLQLFCNKMKLNIREKEMGVLRDSILGRLNIILSEIKDPEQRLARAWAMSEATSEAMVYFQRALMSIRKKS